MDINPCELIQKIAQDPKVKLSLLLGRDITVREIYLLQAHVAECRACNDVLDEIERQYPTKPEFYKGEPN